MPKRKRNRRRRKHNHRNHYGGNNELETFQNDRMRTYTALESPSAITSKITEEFGFKNNLRTPSPELELLTLRSRSLYLTSRSPVRKRRSISRESPMGCSALPLMFNLSENAASFITDLRTCQSSTILEPQTGSSRTKFRSSSSMAKLHSPGLEKIPLKAETGTQTYHDINTALITETPRVNHDDLLELEYKINLINKTPMSEYGTPLKRMRLNDNLTPIFDLKDTAVRIQDLNNFQNEQTGHKLNCSRVFSGDSLKRLKNFNELILNTSQSIDYDNCESPLETEDTQQELEDVQIENEVQENIDVSGEISFFTPQLYNGKTASTPIEKKKGPKTSKIMSNTSEAISNKIEIVNYETFEKITIPTQTTVVASTQAPDYPFRNIGVQTSSEVKFTPAPVLKIRASKEKPFTVTKRRSYKSLSPAIMYYKASPKRDLRVSPIRRVSLERSDSADTIAAIETCARIIAKIKKYHGKYSSKLPSKIIEICTWLGITIKKGVTSLYKLYTQQKALNESTIDLKCKLCNLYQTQISVLTSTVDELKTEINDMKQKNKEKSEKFSSVCTEVDKLRQELTQFEGLKTEIKEIKERLAKPITAPPPPPPPPPPPLLLPSNPLISNRPTKIAGRKKSVDARPIISLDDILKVKLRKIGDRPSPLQRRATEPMVQKSVLKQVKLRPTLSRPQTPSSHGSLSGTSSLSNSPCSSLTRVLSNIDTNVRRVKRLQRMNAYSFDDFSRKNRRERENNEFL